MQWQFCRCFVCRRHAVNQSKREIPVAFPAAYNAIRSTLEHATNTTSYTGITHRKKSPFFERNRHQQLESLQTPCALYRLLVDKMATQLQLNVLTYQFLTLIACIDCSTFPTLPNIQCYLLEWIQNLDRLSADMSFTISHIFIFLSFFCYGNFYRGYLQCTTRLIINQLSFICFYPRHLQ